VEQGLEFHADVTGSDGATMDALNSAAESENGTAVTARSIEPECAEKMVPLA